MPSMNVLSTAEITQMQSIAQAALDLPCTIQRVTSYTVLSSGGRQPIRTVVSPVGLLAGMAQPTAGQLQNFEYMIGSKAAWQVKFPVGTSVLELDWLFINGEKLEVAKVLTPRSLAVLLTILAVEVK